MPQILYVLKSKLLPVFVGMALCLSAFSPAAAAEISSLRIGQGIGNIRVVFDADSKFDYKVFLLTEPRRLVIDTQNVSVNPKIEKVVEPNSFITQARLGTAGVDGVRIVLDLQKPAVVKKVLCCRRKAISAGVLSSIWKWLPSGSSAPRWAMITR
ncbi:MAG: AMIN domain-containing protein [Alphaproteobacteria bacterium]